MKQSYTKPTTDYKEQIELLKSRGLIVNNDQYGINYLKTIRYYRFSGFCLPFESKRHKFNSDIHLEDVIQLINYDKAVRQLLWSHIETLETFFKSIISYHLSRNYGSFCHESNHIFKDSFDHQKWINKVHEEIDRSKERFIKHFKENYIEFPQLPIWVAIETMTFGTISLLFKNLRKEDQISIAKEIGIHHTLLNNWLHTLTYIRNICAGHRYS